jgi:hypothetical protein
MRVGQWVAQSVGRLAVHWADSSAGHLAGQTAG